MEQVNVHEAKTHFSRLIDRVHQGEQIIIAKSGQAYVRLVPLETNGERQEGRYEDCIPPEFFEPLENEELAAWEN